MVNDTFSTPITVVKLSGKALSAGDKLDELFAALRAKPCLIVHGGGVEADDLLKRLGFTSKRLNGLRVTSAQELYYIAGAFGSCGRSLQARAQKMGLKSLSLACSDYEFLKVSPLAPEYGEVGTCKPHSCRGIYDLFAHGFTPILCSLGLTPEGRLLNINADDVAAAAAAALDAKLVFLSDVPGVLDENGQVIAHLDSAKAQDLIARGVIAGGMTVKVEQALNFSRHSHQPIVIASIYDENLSAILDDGCKLGSSIEA
ncbi:MAG: acetylglutamate kinase [Candidatus Anaerobiospirillum merdipullorum]|uniref:Acetylglutamate kinase n=1 Tax=Candidatus Anaerobiospirillum merdipullorum TaxID=2838450 RepID=A0A9E2KPR7_9GAMM|nr:acetylglutamate kinase [Candidatus Anaerobiospirillum merdipullorum]